MASFHPFPRLPAELQLKIWKWAVIGVEPRTVEVIFKKRACHSPSTGLSWTKYIVTQTPAPALLYACRDARDQARTRYKPSFLTGPDNEFVWIDFNVDMVDIGQKDIRGILEELKKFKRLKIHREMSESFFHFESHELRNLPNIQEIHIVALDDVFSWYEIWHDFYWPCARDKLWVIDKETGKLWHTEEIDRVEGKWREENWEHGSESE